MNNPFDEQIKQSLENFEMPYDAGAWAELAQQLPASPTAPGFPSSGIIWKAATVVLVVGASLTALWYLNQDSSVTNETSTIEVVDNEFVTEPSEIKPTISQPINEAPSRRETEPVKKTASQTNRNESGASNALPSESEKAELPKAEVVEQTSSPEPTVKKESNEVAVKPQAAKVELKPFVAKFIASSMNVCVGEDVNFINESSSTKAKMTWDFGDGQVSDLLNPTHSFQVSGTYTVRLTGKDGDRQDDHRTTIVVNNAPRADLSPTEKLPGYKAIPFYHFETAALQNETVSWKFTDGRVATGAQVDHLFRDGGKTGVTLSVKNNFGCTSTSFWSMENEKFNLLAYSGFSPDVNGLNETFMPPALPLLGLPFEMIIRDQKGQEVYKTSNALEPWNGKLNNTGDKLPPATYIWTVILKENVLNKKDFNGTITIKP